MSVSPIISALKALNGVDCGKPVHLTNGQCNGHDSSAENLPADRDAVPLAPSLSLHSPGENLFCLRLTNQVKEMQTILRDRSTNRSEFIFYADRLIRLVVEEGLSLLPYNTVTVTTPTGDRYNGLRYVEGNCGVSIIRSGEAMEKGLRDCCRSIRIGKILVKADREANTTRVLYHNLPSDIDNCQVLLLYPILNSGLTVINAMRVLDEYGVLASNILLLNLFATPEAVHSLLTEFPNMRILTSELFPIAPLHFSEKYFGTG